MKANGRLCQGVFNGYLFDTLIDREKARKRMLDLHE